MISIVIPTLDEEASLPRCLASLAVQPAAFEIIVTDGGSTDWTREIAAAAGARVVCGPRGRAAQMNRGADVARGDVLWFLHADTLAVPDALARIRAAVARGIEVGGFTMRFDRSDLAHRTAAAIATLYSHATGELYGDRAIFATRDAFAALGGYRERALMEDLDFSVRVRDRGFRTRLLPGPVVTSARRFRGVGIVRGGWLAWRLTRDFHHGAAPTGAARRLLEAVRR